MLGSELITIAAATAIMTFALSMLIVFSQRWHGRLSHDHDLNGVQKVHTSAVPRVGGIAVVAGVLFGSGFYMQMYPGVITDTAMDKLLLLLGASLPAFFAGVAEDLTKKVSVKIRLVASIFSALLASWFLGAIVDELNIWGVDSLLTWTPFALIVTAVTVAGGVNSINIIDGFNGLASSTVVVMLAALAAVSWHVGDILVAELAMVGLGAAVGFLVVNYPRGRLFLGDGGAYFLGFWVAEIVVLLLVRNADVNAWQVFSICAYPVIEVLYSIYRRKIIRHASPGAPDGLHLHTLVYRRVVSRLFRHDAESCWKRNAAVACLIVPWVAGAALLSVIAGGTIASSAAIVVAQVVVYVTVYARLVRGRWGARTGEALRARRRERDRLALKGFR